MSSTANDVNAAQIEHWNGPAGETWVKLQTRLDAQLAPLGHLAMDGAGLRPGESVLDVGCGTGATTLELSRRVSPNGKVVGIDISRPMLSFARQRLEAAGFPQTRFEEGDAQTRRLSEGGFDLVFSRFGVMFFADPVAAFKNLRAALNERGRLSFVCWRRVADNPWVAVPMAAAFQHIPQPPPSPPGGPGEFSFAERERVHDILARAGFKDITIEAKDMLVGGASLDVTVDTTLAMGPIAAALREADPVKREPVAHALRQAFAPYENADGVRLGAGVWLARARSENQK
ncbi:MAG: class I SAM-dependent methyltransferase [Hyphomicrobiales bacterium]|nr:class I SAM-dependent methyltransferase [Hyphomicrobiales bacterium]